MPFTQTFLHKGQAIQASQEHMLPSPVILIQKVLDVSGVFLCDVFCPLVFFASASVAMGHLPGPEA